VHGAPPRPCRPARLQSTKGTTTGPGVSASRTQQQQQQACNRRDAIQGITALQLQCAGQCAVGDRQESTAALQTELPSAE